MPMKKIALTSLLLATSVTYAGVITKADSVSSPNGPDPSGWGLTHLIDQSGLLANYISGVTDFATFTSATNAEYFSTGAANALGGAATNAADFDFDLGAVMSIGGLAIWNQAGSASVNIFDVYGSVDGITYSLLGSGFGPPVQSGSNAPAYVASWAAQSMRYVRLDVISNFGFAGATRFNEIAFDQVSAVPVPGTLPLLALGFIAFGLNRPKRG